MNEERYLGPFVRAEPWPTAPFTAHRGGTRTQDKWSYVAHASR